MSMRGVGEGPFWESPAPQPPLRVGIDVHLRKTQVIAFCGPLGSHSNSQNCPCEFSECQTSYNDFLTF